MQSQPLLVHIILDTAAGPPPKKRSKAVANALNKNTLSAFVDRKCSAAVIRVDVGRAEGESYYM